MIANTLYKYLDVDGGLARLEHQNLQFTNATKFNDPFDCHPALQAEMRDLLQQEEESKQQLKELFKSLGYGLE